MRTLLNTSTTLWIFYYFGPKAFPELYQYPILLWSAIILLAILLPIGFGGSLSAYFNKTEQSLKSILLPTYFLGIFLAALIWPLTTTYGLNSLTSTYHSDIKLLKGVTIAQTEESRQFWAKTIFEEYGQRVAYKNASNEFVLYEPTVEDTQKYKEKKKFNEDYEKTMINIGEQSLSAMQISLMLTILFFVFFVLTLVYMQKREAIRS